MPSLEQRLLNEFQRGFPLSATPYADVARHLGIEEAGLLREIERLQEEGKIGRIGAVVRPGAAGASTLAAMEIPQDRLEEVAALVTAFTEVNHNYEREHRLNLWFVVTGRDRDHVLDVLSHISRRTGLAVLDLPLVDDLYSDLGFDLQWS